MVQKTKIYNKQRALSDAVQLVYQGQANKALSIVKKHFTANSGEYLFFKGWVSQLRGEIDKAISWFEKSLKKQPTNIYSLEGLVGCYIDTQQYSFAVECAEQLNLLDKNSAKNTFTLATARSYCFRGHKQELTNTLEYFIKAYDLAIEEKDLTLLRDILLGWGACLVDLRRFQEAKVILETIKDDYPDTILLHKNLASVYSGLNMNYEAIESCKIASMSDNPDIANDALYQMGMLYLSLGDYRAGWRLHEFRHKLKEFSYAPTDKVPFWDGKPLSKDKKLLIYQEQGIGDTIQFSRYIKDVKTRVDNIDLEVYANPYVKWEDCAKEPNSLKKLFSENYKQLNNIYIKGYSNIDYNSYDYIISLMSLPRLFKTTLGNIPSIPYLKTNTKIDIPVQDIGIFWKGSSSHVNDDNRSIDTKLIEQFILFNSDKKFLNLQLDRDEDLSTFSNVTNAKEHINDFTDTLALLNKCRIVVTVDSMIAHLAGSANIPTVVLHANSPDWRWLQDRKDSPWYPSIVNIRQKTEKNWKSVIIELQEQIDSLFKSEIIID